MDQAISASQVLTLNLSVKLYSKQSLGLRKGELLGLTWELVNLDAGELYVGEQVQRVGHQLLRRETKTETSEAPLPLPDVCVTALKLRRQQQDTDHARAAGAWTGLRGRAEW